MHIESNSTTDWRVYLTRRHDKWHIPYKVINSMTLIALLRMGILDEIKKKFYEQFLRMKFYEDMAPWNIVFRGGHLEYIDYDTKDHPLTSVLPFAYQIMAALMNYERTVNDFGGCHGHAKNEFGLSFISHCVKSSFGGPCKESRYPVPCGDYSCRESYPACLLAMKEIEIKAKHSNDMERLVPSGNPAMSTAQLLAGPDGVSAVTDTHKAPVNDGTSALAGVITEWSYGRQGKVNS